MLQCQALLAGSSQHADDGGPVDARLSHFEAGGETALTSVTSVSRGLVLLKSGFLLVPLNPRVVARTLPGTENESVDTFPAAL